MKKTILFSACAALSLSMVACGGNPNKAKNAEAAAEAKAEAKAATNQLKAERAARAAAGKPPIACVPEGESIGIMDMLDGLSELPAADQKRPLKDGYAKVIAKRYPCR